MTGRSQFLASNQGIMFTFLKPPEERPPIQRSRRQDDGQASTSIPGVMTFLRPFPVLEISTGATNQNQGQYAFSVSGVNPEQVYDAGAEADGEADGSIPAFSRVSSDYYNNTPNLDIESGAIRPRLYGVSEARILTLAAQRLFAKLSLPDQEAGGSVSGDSGDAQDSARETAGGSVAALHQIRRRQATRAAERAGQLGNRRSDHRRSIT